MCKLDGYREKVFESLKQLNCLDGKDQDNQSVDSDSDLEDEYGEEAEHDLLGGEEGEAEMEKMLEEHWR